MSTTTIEKHQYGFAIMNDYTGNIRRKSFWGKGETEEECKLEARRQADAYAAKLADQSYEKACRKNTERGLPSRSSYTFTVVGQCKWK
jgi:hypothetical protein